MGTNYYWYPAVDDFDVTWLRNAAEAERSEGWSEFADRLHHK